MASGKPKIAFAGLGAMGGGMATNLVKNGFEVTGYDVYRPLLDKFVAAGGKASSSPRDAASGADILISMVANAAQNSTLLFDGPDAAIAGLGEGKTFILCSTCAPDFALEIRSRLDRQGRRDVRFLDCPVSGGTFRAADGTLSIFESGPFDQLDAAADVLRTMSANLYRMGDISAGTKTKTVHQLTAATNIVAAAEAAGLAATVGLNTKTLLDHVRDSAGASFFFDNRVPHMLADDWKPYSAVAIILKDTGIVTETARKVQWPTPLASTAEQIYLTGVQANMTKDDDAKLVQLYLPRDQGDLVAKAASADPKMASSHQVSKDTIVDLLTGIHLAAAIEAMAFGQKLGLSTRVMCEIISKAAGWSAAFTTYIPPMVERDSWSLADCPGAEQVGARLSEAVAKCRQIGYPCPMASAALAQYGFARLSTGEALVRN